MKREPLDAVERLACVQTALEYLTLARNILKDADAPKTMRRVRLAISSAKGAERNAECRIDREYYHARQVEEESDREGVVLDNGQTIWDGPHAPDFSKRVSCVS